LPLYPSAKERSEKGQIKGQKQPLCEIGEISTQKKNKKNNQQ